MKSLVNKSITQKYNYTEMILRSYPFFLFVIIFVLFFHRFFILGIQHQFDTDELEHLQDAWLLSQGLSIYRDFFEHHPPLLYLYLAPFLTFLNGVEKLFVARILMFPFAFGILGFVYLLASKISGRLAGLFASLFLSMVFVFQEKSIEIRPDVPALFFLMFSLWTCFSLFRAPFRLIFMGIFFGTAILFTPKVIFAFPAFLAIIANKEKNILAIMRNAGWISLGLIVPCGLVSFYLLMHDSLKQAFFFNVNFNISVPFTYQRVNLSDSLLSSFRLNWCFWFLSFASVCTAVGNIVKWQKNTISRNIENVITFAVIGMIVGLFTIQVPLKQYVMFLCCLLSILAGVFASDLFFLLKEKCKSNAMKIIILIISTIVLLHPLPSLLSNQFPNNNTDINRLLNIWNVIPPNEKIFDCWTGYGLFRKPAFFYQFLGPDIIGALTSMSKSSAIENSGFQQYNFEDSLLAALKKNKPMGIINDPMLNFLPPRVLDYIRSHYYMKKSNILFLRKE